MNKLHLASIGFIKPAIDVLENNAIRIYPSLHESRLDIYDLNRLEGYIPVRKMYAFLNLVSRELGSESLVLFRNELRLANAGFVGETVANTPDLLSAINRGIKLNRFLLTNERVELVINGTVSTIRQWYTDKPASGQAETELLSFFLLYDGIKIAGGADWSPLAIQIQGPEIPLFDTLFIAPDQIHIQFNQPYTSISFPTSLLIAPMLGNSVQTDIYKDMFLPAENLPSQLYCLMDSSHRLLDLLAASEELCVSSRTVKRHLRAQGTSYSEVCDQWRFKKAISLLGDANKSINEIAQILHYSNTANFIRAFTRWTSTTPMSYRRELF